MSRYIIHVGMTKTGSSYLQSCLRDSSKALLTDGFLYPDDCWTSPNETHHGAIFHAVGQGVDTKTEAIFDRLNALPDRTIILSCESFFGLGARHLQRLLALMGSNPCEIVIYLRPWSQWIQSHWRQVVKAGRTETFPEAFSRLLRNPSGYQTNYIGTLDLLASVFGNDAIRVVSYSNLIDAKKNMMEHFCESILEIRGVPISPDRIVNQSTDLRSTELVRWLNAWCIARGLPTTTRNARAVLRAWNDPELATDLDFLSVAMDAHRAVVKVDDQLWAAQYDILMEQYGDKIVNPGPDGDLFQRKAVEVSYIRDDCLLSPDVAECLDRVFRRLVDRRR